MSATSPKTSILAAATAMALAPAAALIFLAPGASAQTRGQSASIAIEIAASPVGAAAEVDTHAQIGVAARKACAAVAMHSPLLPREQSDCVRDTTAKAIVAMKRDTITLASK